MLREKSCFLLVIIKNTKKTLYLYVVNVLKKHCGVKFIRPYFLHFLWFPHAFFNIFSTSSTFFPRYMCNVFFFVLSFAQSPPFFEFDRRYDPHVQYSSGCMWALQGSSRKPLIEVGTHEFSTECGNFVRPRKLRVFSFLFAQKAQYHPPQHCSHKIFYVQCWRWGAYVS